MKKESRKEVSELTQTMKARLPRSKNAARSAELRERVESWIAWYTRTTGATRDGAKAFFIERSYETAEQNDMRVWKVRKSAGQSLDVLLKEKSFVNNGVTYTGTNDSWVSDIFEATLNKLEQEITADAEITINLRDAIEEMIMQTVDTRPLSIRILDAYDNLETERMVELVLEVDRLENAITP